MGGSTGGTSKQSPMLGGAPTTNPAQARVGALRNKIPAKQPFGSPMAATQPAMQAVPQTGQPAEAPATPTPAPTVQPPQPPKPVFGGQQAQQAQAANQAQQHWQQDWQPPSGGMLSASQGMPGGSQGMQGPLPGSQGEIASRFGQEQANQNQLRSQLESGFADPAATMSAIGQYNQLRQSNAQQMKQNFDPAVQQQMREQEDALYKQFTDQNKKFDQSTFEGFQAANALRAARPETNAQGWNDVAAARSRSKQFAQMTPEQFAQRQADIARQREEARTGRVG